MNIKSTFLIFFVSVGIFATSLAYNLNLYLSSRNIRRITLPVPIKDKAGSDKKIPVPQDGVGGKDLLSLTNLFSPTSGMSIPGKWIGKGTETIAVRADPSEFHLSGTIYSEMKDLRRAVIFFTKTREEKAFKEGDYIDQSTKLLTIERNTAIVSQNGKRMALAVIPDENKVASKNRESGRQSGNRVVTQPSRGGATPEVKVSKLDDFTYAVDESSVDYLTENINKVITQVRIIPYFESGEAAGFRFAAIRPGSIFSDLGFSSGDVIKQINGVPLTSPEKIYTIFQNLKDEKKIEVDILRRGQKKTMAYEIR